MVYICFTVQIVLLPKGSNKLVISENKMLMHIPVSYFSLKTFVVDNLRG